ncbi:MAG TPA: hypothetical protein VKH41_12450, partial [Myxococcota bacterium]|nr:hypothetical protein [Myxococcota bacterium]
IVYLEQNRLEDALGATDRAVQAARSSPPPPRDSARLLWIRGVVLAKLDRPADAEQAWKAALVFDPDNAEARAALEGGQPESGAGAAIKPAP